MADPDLERTLRPIERKDGTWTVEVTAPNAVGMHVGSFASAAEAQDWIIHKANAYFIKGPDEIA